MASDIEHQLPRQEIDDESTHSFRPRWISLCSFCRIIVKVAKVLLIAVFLVPCLALSVALVIGFPLVGPLAMLIMYSLPKASRRKLLENLMGPGSSRGTVAAGMYDQSRRRLKFMGRLLRSLGGVFPRASLLLLVWLALNTSVPRLRNLTLAGSPLWKWSLEGVTITSAYFVALQLYLAPAAFFLLTHYTPGSSMTLRPLMGYFYCGLMPSGTLVMYFAMVLLSWLLYFRTDSGLKQPSTPHPEVFQHATWTCVSLFLGSILWLLKSYLLLKWTGDAIYRRFEPRILITGVKYVYLGLLVEGFFEEDIITQLRLEDQSKPRKISVAKYIISRKLEISYLEYVGCILTSLAETVSSQEEDGVSDVVDWFEDKIQNFNQQKCVLNDLLKLLPSAYETSQPNINKPKLFSRRNLPEVRELKEDPYRMAEVLCKLVQEELSTDGFTYDDLKKWMVDSHKDCVNMGRTLADAKAIVTRLDIFLSFTILAAVVLFWLLITGIATTQVLVAIATPLLALTFIFGDTAKTFFQGLVFCFATHAFDVGDRCVLDNTELEVKSINILTTTFIKIGTKEKSLYPNSVLATKAIVNLGWQPDPSDVVELTLDPSTNIENLEDQIMKFFFENKSYYQGSHKVMIKEVGENIKVIVTFTHVLTVHDLMHSRCPQKKREQRSHFLKVVKQFLNESRTKSVDGVVTV